MAQYYEYTPRPSSSINDDHSYIFPNPQSTFADDDHDILVLSPISLSEPSSSRATSQSPLASPFVLNDTDIEWESPAEELPPPLPRWEMILRRRRSEAQLQSQSQPCAEKKATQPHPRMRIPLLSYFASLLAIDEATLHLITHTPDKSVLFPVSIPHTPEDVDKHVLRGLEKLFAASGTNPETRVIVAGFAAAADEEIPPSAFVTAPFAGILGMVTTFVASKSKALREVLHY
ncbi:hypothetical protein HGRIS_006090 [Hohenbuehelia grisea]|uniref:Uncharacterized protein n=1 Tax=Hohenbuehelia grisea TaxID=104357 RepID=A0ABR3JYS1_9AGAR